MRKYQMYLTVIIIALVFLSVGDIASAQSRQVIPAASPVSKTVSKATNYQKCLNKALLNRETSGKIAYQKFDKAVEDERNALLKAFKPFSGWLSWLNAFRPEDMKNYEKARAEFMEAVERESPARDAALKQSVDKFSVDQQFCVTHQDATYEWTAADQKALDALIPSR
ncbi:MAG: hypothetical protein WC767_03340 [Candidatus Paceibacterota bacterium]